MRFSTSGDCARNFEILPQIPFCVQRSQRNRKQTLADFQIIDLASECPSSRMQLQRGAGVTCWVVSNGNGIFPVRLRRVVT